MNTLFDRTVMLVQEEGIIIDDEKPEAIYYYSFHTEIGEMRYTFLPKFVAAMSELHPECQFAGYIANQNENEHMGVELAITYKEESVLFSFDMHWIGKQNHVYVYTYILRFDDDFFSHTELKYVKHEDFFRNIRQDAMQYIENLPEYRLFFVTNTKWEIAE